jgi:hypothetical protein
MIVVSIVIIEAILILISSKFVNAQNISISFISIKNSSFTVIITSLYKINVVIVVIWSSVIQEI